MTLEHAFELFERFVAAQEKLADTLAANMGNIFLPIEKVDSASVPAIEAPVAELNEKESKSLLEVQKNDREWLKRQLDELGVDYTSRMATQTLVKKYETAIKEKSKEEEGKNSSEILSIDGMRTRLKTFVDKYGKHGREAVKQKINELGAVNLTALDTEKYPQLIDFVQTYEEKMG